MREIRLYGSEGGGAVRSPYPYQPCPRIPDFHFRGMRTNLRGKQFNF